MKPLQPTINDILDTHFSPLLSGVTGVRRRRLELVEEHLRACLETDGERILEQHDVELLAREREFGTANAFATTMHAEDLVYVLAIWTRAPWLLSEPAALRVQLSAADALLKLVFRQRLVRYEAIACPLIDVEHAVKVGRAALRASRARQAPAPTPPLP
jgi:hypothetical protein